MTTPQLVRSEPWAAHPSAAPITRKTGDSAFTAEANGTPFCCGGWHFAFAGVTPSQPLEITVTADLTGIDCPRDALLCTLYWGEIAADSANVPITIRKQYLLPDNGIGPGVTFTGTVEPPEGAECLTVRCTLRWIGAGSVTWSAPTVEPVAPPPPTPDATIAVVTGTYQGRPAIKSVTDNVAFYADLCADACRAHSPDLILLPEIALQWGLPQHAWETAVSIPGPETAPFAEQAAAHSCMIAVGLLERENGAVRNTVALIGRNGSILGKYWKVHLAAGGENESGILPGDDFPVLHTDIGRLGFNICMDSSAAESSRMVGLNGADFLLLPIMGDHRASRWTAGNPIFNESRWTAIMRTRAMDNQLTMVVARNQTAGSCVIDRKGDILAWNEGDQPHIAATVPTADGFRMWNNLCFREVNWMQRRPHLYGSFVDDDNVGSL